MVFDLRRRDRRLAVGVFVEINPVQIGVLGRFLHQVVLCVELIQVRCDQQKGKCRIGAVLIDLFRYLFFCARKAKKIEAEIS